MFWLLHEDTLRQLRDMEKRVVIGADQQRAWLEHEQREAADRGPRSLRVAGEVAEIRVEGLLTKRPDFWAQLFGLGGTAYVDLLEAIAVARSNPEVKAVQLYVDSPGGSADGLFDVFAALEQLRAEKPVRVRAANAYSAAYGIAAVAGNITATTPASMFGSVGVAVRYSRWADVEVYDITNTESPDKRPDPATAEGQAVIRRELDAIFDLFAEAIAKGRSAATGETVTRSDVAENFGRGASFVAKDAKRHGMIDTTPKALARTALRVVSEVERSAARGQESEMSETTKNLTIEELRAQHPALYTAVLQEGAAAGVTQERDRVCAHLEMAEMSGKPDASSGLHIALESIRSGAAVTQTLMAKYMSAGMNSRDRQARQTETDQAGKTADGAQPAPETKGDEATFQSSVLAELERRRGKKAPAPS
jgi:ClpP class serine protease